MIFISLSYFPYWIRTLAQRGEKEHNVENTKSKKEMNSSVFTSNLTSTLGTMKPANRSKPARDFGPDVETYCDERGRIRVSRVRAMGIRMTRDIQRNLDFIKESEQVKSKGQTGTNVHNGSTANEEPPDFPEHLFESNKPQSSCSPDEDLSETDRDNHQTSSQVVAADNISESSCYGNKEAIEISFSVDQTEVKDGDEDMFLQLVSGTTSNIFSDNNCLVKNTEEPEDSECIWEDGVVEAGTSPMKVDKKDHKSSLPENCSNDDMEWEEGDSFVPGVASSSEQNPCNAPKGDLEEAALVQEAIRRSLEDFEKMASENVSTGDIQASVEDRSLQFSNNVPKISEALGENDSHSGIPVVEELNNETRTEINCNKDDIIQGTGLLGTDRQENETRPQLVNNDGHLGSVPLCTTFTSNLAEKTSNSTETNGEDVMIFATKIPETAVGDCDKTSGLNIVNSDQSKCSKGIASTGGTFSHQKDLLIDDELLAATVEQKENAAQGDLKFATSEIDYTQICDNDDNHTISASYVDAELSRLRQEQIDLGHERRKLESHAEAVSSEMFAECQV